MTLHTLPGPDRVEIETEAERPPPEPERPLPEPLGDPDRPGRVAPLIPIAVALVLGVIADRLGDPWGTAAWAGLALGASAVALVGFRWRGLCVPAVLVAFAAIGGGWHHWRWSGLDGDDLGEVVTEQPRPGWVRGIVRTVPEHRVGWLDGERPGDEGYTRFELQLTGASDGERWFPASGRAMVSVGGDCSDLGMGEAIEAAGMLSRIAGPLNPGERDPRDYPRSRGIRLRLSVDNPEGLALAPEGNPHERLRRLGRIRSACERHLSAMLSDRTAPMASALLLGRRGGLDGATSSAFSRTGTAHLLAISGLHLSAVAGVLGFVAIVMGMPHKAAAWLVLTATLSYATLVGWTPSVSRASVMVAAVCLAKILDRSSRATSTISVAVLLTILVNPAFVFGVGWQLSFLAVSTLIFGVPPLLRRLERRTIDPDPDQRPLDWLQQRLEPRWKTRARRLAFRPVLALVASAAVWLATMPLIAWRFNVVAPIGILLNLALIPLVGLAVVTGGLVLVCSAVWAPLGWPAAKACDASLRLALAIVERAEAIPWGHAFVPTPPTAWVIAAYAAFALASYASAARWSVPVRRGAWVGVALVGLIGAGATIAPQRPPSYQVEVLAVGHGLATVIRGPDGSASLYDCGRSGDPSVGRRIAAPALWSRGIRRIDSVVLSHADSDHYNGVPDLIERFSIGRVVVPDGFDEENNPGARALLDRVRARGIAVQEVALGDRFEVVPGLEAEVLHPPRGWLPDASDNDRSLVLDLAIDGRHLLLTGDLDGAGLAEVVGLPRRPVDVMVAPHHGGRTANPPWLYDWADPLAVVSSQRAPRAGTTDALEGLPGRGIAVHRTFQEGAIGIRWVPGDSTQGRGRSGWIVVESPENPGGPSAEQGPRLVASSIGGGPSMVIVRVLIVVGGILMGAWLCGATTVVTWGAWSLVLPGRADSKHPESFAEPWRSTSIASADGLRLSGWWRAGGDPTGRIALVVHGLAEASASMHGRAEALHRAGWSVLVPDLRSFGRSDGDRASFGARESGDLIAWIDRALADHPGAPVVAWGRSMGAAVCLKAAAEDPRVAAVVLEAPYADLRDALAARLRRLPLPGAARLSGLVLWNAARLAGARLDRPRPLELADQVSCPVLILQGDADTVAPTSEIQRLARAFPESRRPEVARVSGAGHNEVFDRGGQELLGRVLGFLDQALQSRRIEDGGSGP